ncbi:hypothetical protein KUTeg_013952 [Tegillarca granosa]|uniref:VWFD domain-containing protein n=1 Tax=Tegillarca granosa TaxID=220873 RepID=A0ABQ9EV65_TEGGR|nr:hypothetical protein KUTeg_013952 [Tegillarca granosa]
MTDQIPCMFTAAKTTNPNVACPFDIEVKQEHRGDRLDVAYVRMLSIKMFNKTIRFLLGRIVEIDGNVVNTPYHTDEFEITNSGEGSTGLLTLVTSCEVIVTFDGEHRAEIRAPESYAGELTGKCGNCDGNPNDFVLRNGTDVSDRRDRVNLVAISYMVEDTSDVPEEDRCDSTNVEEEIPTEKECEENVLTSADTAGCFVFSSSSSFNPFKACIENRTVEAATKYEECRYDYCHTSDVEYEGKDTICKNIASFVEICDEAGINLASWRDIIGCPVVCGENSHYDESANSIQPSCENPNVEDGIIPVYTELCVCNDDYILSNKKCVMKSECGCNVGPEYFPLGYKRMNDECTAENVCVHEDGNSFMKPTAFNGCKENEECSLVDGVRKCSCVDGFVEIDGRCEVLDGTEDEEEEGIDFGEEEDKACMRLVTCKSSKKGYTECEVPMRVKKIKLKENLGSGKCKKGKTYGIKSKNAIFVKYGCKGTFAVFCNDKKKKGGGKKGKWWNKKPQEGGECGENARQKGKKCVCNKNFYGNPYEGCFEGCYCRIGGDTHIRMYDGGKLDNQAPCMYTLTRSTKPNDECRFNVEVKQGTSWRGNGCSIS